MQLLTSVILPSIGVAVLVAIVAFFASSETAYLSITKVTLKQMLKEDISGKKNSPARRVAFLKKNTDQLLSLVLIGINFITSFASSLAATVAINMFGDAGATYATIIMAFVLIIFGEISPKTVASVKPVQIAEAYSLPLIVLEKVLFPVVWFFAKVTNGITILMNGLFKHDSTAITEEELKSLIDVGEHEGTLEQDEKKMLYRIFDFSDLQVRDIMRHRSLVKMIPADADYDEVVKIFRETGYSRIPVCGPDKENTTDCSFENVLGVILYKTVLTRNPDAKSNKSFAERCMHPALFIPETLSAAELLVKLRKEKVSFAIAVDENGSNSGIVTNDDVLRAVFGRSVIAENAEASPEDRIQPVSPTEYLVPGDMKLDDVNELLKLNLESDDYDTLGGWLLEQFDELPDAGAAISKDGVVFTIEDQSQRRIQSVMVKLPKAPTS